MLTCCCFVLQAGTVWMQRNKDGDEVVELLRAIPDYFHSIEPFDRDPSGMKDPQSWWTAVGKVKGAGQIASMALFLLRLTPHSADPERTFSTMGWIHSDTRNRLAPHRVGDMTQARMMLEHKLVEEGIKPPPAAQRTSTVKAGAHGKRKTSAGTSQARPTSTPVSASDDRPLELPDEEEEVLKDAFVEGLEEREMHRVVMEQLEGAAADDVATAGDVATAFDQMFKDFQAEAVLMQPIDMELLEAEVFKGMNLSADPEAPMIPEPAKLPSSVGSRQPGDPALNLEELLLRASAVPGGMLDALLS